MARIQIMFKDAYDDNKISCESKNDFVLINGYDKENNCYFQIVLDKSTSIKFAKTIRTEINKITENE